MPKAHASSPSHTQQLLGQLIGAPGSTKPELCERTGLPVSTVHNAISSLLNHGLIQEMGAATSSGGRCPMQYHVNNSLGVVVAVSIRLQHVTAGVFDLLGNALLTRQVDMACAGFGPESYTGELAQLVLSLLEQAHQPLPCLGVGVTVPGPVQEGSGVVYQISGAPGWRQFPLQSRLQEALGMPVIVEKDVYAAIQYLHRSGQLRARHCSVCLSICEGIGAAVIIDGKVFRGVNSLVGEIGHLTVRRDGIPCNCGNTGCLELYCSDIGIVKQYNDHSGAHCTHVDEVVALVRSGDETAARVLSQAIRYLVDTTATIIMSYNPEELLIYCRWLDQEKKLYFRMLDTLYAKSLFTQQQAMNIRLLSQMPIHLNAAASMAQYELLMGLCGK